MNLMNHIPFGLREKDLQFVDIADVPRGKECGCICPSCHIPLIARQGIMNRWHFSHTSRKIEVIDQSCQYSFFVSVRAMAKQIIESGSLLSTPGCTDMVSSRRDGMFFSESFCVTKPDTITLGDVQKECLFEGTMVDICAEVKGYPLVIYFSHPERSVPISLKEPRNNHCGVLEINLTETRALFLAKKTTYERFDDEIRTFIEGNDHAKKWIFHPRKSTALSEAKVRLEEQLTNWKPPRKRTNIRINPYIRSEGGGESRYECLICKKKWSVLKNQIPVCPVCQVHFYARLIG